jgi:hypothetical protein
MKEGADDAGISVLDMFGSIEAGQASWPSPPTAATPSSSVQERWATPPEPPSGVRSPWTRPCRPRSTRSKPTCRCWPSTSVRRWPPTGRHRHRVHPGGVREPPARHPQAKEVVSGVGRRGVRAGHPGHGAGREVIEKVVDWVRTFIKENPHAGPGRPRRPGRRRRGARRPRPGRRLRRPVLPRRHHRRRPGCTGRWGRVRLRELRDLPQHRRHRRRLAGQHPLARHQDRGRGIVTAFWAVVKFFQDDFVPIV